MKTEIVKLDAGDVDPVRIKEAAALVDSGGLVAFPTETVYGIACRARSDSLARLTDLKGRTADKHFTVHIGQRDDVKKYVPTVKLNAQKLIRNAWPGPVTIVFELEAEETAKQQSNFERDVFESLYNRNSIGIRCPDHAVASTLLRQTSNPVVAPSANRAGEPPAVDADQVLAQLSGQIEMLLDGGPTTHKRSSTVVKMGKKGMEVLRPGVYSLEQLRAWSQIRFLFVCTGNTCRSPMAEGVCRKYLAEKACCNVDDLERIGYKVSSVGIIGTAGLPATAEAVTACAAKGIDISAHRNQGLSRELIRASDFIFAMEQVHRQRIIALDPTAVSRCLLLAGSRGVPDPIGHPQEFYDRCADMIEQAVKKRIGELAI